MRIIYLHLNTKKMHFQNNYNCILHIIENYFSFITYVNAIL